ncbi:MAG: DUF3047 domain-containing protein [Pseudomonadota bacterium]|nr:DUF3047 domain-containing protein [Pseudomonadota bacterium]
MKPKLIFILLLVSLKTYGEKVNVSQFSEQGIEGWKTKIFESETVYKVTDYQGAKYVQAISNKSASGLTRELKVNLETTPFLNWSWIITEILNGNDERKKSGDDFAARIYVIAKTGFGIWNTAAINYVWSNKSLVGEFWPNPFTSKAVMYSVEQGVAGLGKIKSYKQNIREDFKRTFKKDIKKIEAIAIMTDSDNSQKQAKALYGEIFFTSE